MIVVRNLEGRDAPQLLCDVCEQPITDGKMAAVVFKQSDESGAGPTLHPPLYAHKGVCHRAAEQRLGGDEATGWIELYQHLLLLLKNCGLPAAGTGPPARRTRPQIPGRGRLRVEAVERGGGGQRPTGRCRPYRGAGAIGRAERPAIGRPARRRPPAGRPPRPPRSSAGLADLHHSGEFSRPMLGLEVAEPCRDRRADISAGETRARASSARAASASGVSPRRAAATA